MKPATLVATAFLAVVALVHVLRLVFQVQVTVAGNAVPVWMSAVGALFAGGLAFLLWREQRR